MAISYKTKLKTIRKYYTEIGDTDKYIDWYTHTLKQIGEELDRFIDYEYQKVLKLMKENKRKSKK
jgi:hypothetical protein